MIASHKFRPATRGGFTLVEMLTVIVIISILASLVVGGAIAARRAARRAVIKTDISQLEMALENYKGEYGEYPPDFAFCNLAEGDAMGDAARARVANHIRKAFPRMRLSGNTNAQFATFAESVTGLALADYGNASAFFTAVGDVLNPSTALACWLGGMPNAEGKPNGFAKDPANPFRTGEPRTTPFFDFDPARMNGYQLYQPAIQPVSPYVYFRAVRDNTTGVFEYGGISGSTFTPASYGAGTNVCVPYLANVLGATASATPNTSTDQRVWCSPEKFQIIAAGLDGEFANAASPFRFATLGDGLTDADYDNLTNFAKGELQDEL